MGHSQDEKVKSRQRILEVASRRFREAGLEGMSISDLMKEAGLTHGGFYKHFASREDLVASAVDQAMTETARHSAPSLGSLIDKYLSAEHRDAPGGGCAISALAADVGRADAACREVFTEQLRGSLRRISDLSQQAGEDDSVEAAMVRLSAMVGALILARAVDDPGFSEALMEATRSSLTPTSRQAAPARPGRRAASAARDSLRPT